MAKKFLLRKCVTLGLAVLMTVCSSITVLASDATVDSMLRSNSEIIIGIDTEVDNTVTEENLDFIIEESLEDNVKLLASMGTVSRPNSFLEMSEALEKLTGTTVRGNELYGALYSDLTRDAFDKVGGNYEWHIEHNGSITYLKALSNGLLLDIFDNNREQLSEIATKSFSDIDAGAYYASYIPSAVYYGLINGVGDNKFAPNDQLTRAQWILMYAKGFSGAESVNGNEGTLMYGDAINAGCPSWAAGGYVVSGRYMLSIPLFSNSDDAFNKGITRMEVVNSLIKNMSGIEVGDNEPYAIKANQGLAVSPFNDIKSIVSKPEVEARASRNNTTYEEEIYKILTASNGEIDEESYRCLLAAYDLGLIKGMGDGRSGYDEILTRGQAVVFLENFGRIFHDYKINQ